MKYIFRGLMGLGKWLMTTFEELGNDKKRGGNEEKKRV
jgi:hypothetical protein